MVTDGVTTKSGLPAGEYKVVAFDLDTTGKMLMDEFCHIAAYTPSEAFSQYVMPHKDLDLVAKRRHLMRTVTVGRYRMLKDLQTGKFLKTKSEISSLTDFLTWLEKVKGENNAGIILLNYEPFKLAPLLLLEALNKYQLMERFQAVVRGFGDCYAYVKEKCDSTFNSFTLKVVSKVLLDKEDEVCNAANRAKLVYQVMEHLTAGDGDATAGVKVMVDAIREHTSTIEEELKLVDDQKVFLLRQNTLRPIFAPIMKQGMHQRKCAAILRRLITKAFLDYDTLKTLWDEGKDKFEDVVSGKLDATDSQKKEVCKILSDHFDPNVLEPETPMKPRNARRNNPRIIANDREQQSSDVPTTTDTTASTTSSSSPSKSNGVATPEGESPKHESKVEGKLEVKSEVKREVKSEVKREVKVEVKHDLKAEVKHDLKAEVKHDPKAELIKESKAELPKNKVK